MDYGDEQVDTLDELTFIEHKYRSIDSFPVDLTIVTGQGGCELVYRNFAVVKSANGLRIGTIIGDTLDCVGDSTGVITLYSEFGGTPPYMYAFSTSPFGYNRAHDGLAAGYYKVSIRDSVGCIADTAIRVKSPESIVTTYEFTYPTCNQDSLGSIIIDSIKGGWGDYIYTWNGVEGDQTLMDVHSDSSYILKITDARACFVEDTINLDSCVGVTGIEELSLGDQLHIYPNPIVGNAFWVNTKDKMKQVSVYSLTGSLVEQFQVSMASFQVDLKDQYRGIYFLQVELEDGRLLTRKIIID